MVPALKPFLKRFLIMNKENLLSALEACEKTDYNLSNIEKTEIIRITLA